MRRAALAVILLALATGLAGCRRQKAAPSAPPPPRVTVVRPAGVPVRDYWTYNGYLEQTKAVEVRSKVRGYLTGIKFTEGTEVAAGDLLYTIDKLEFNTAVSKADAEEKRAEADALKAEAEVKQALDRIDIAKAQFEYAEADLARVINLSNTGTGSKDQLDLARATVAVRKAEGEASKATHKAAIAAFAAARANHDAARAALHSAKIQLGYTDIKAKIGGRISRTMVDDGTLVQADTTLMTTILEVDRLYVYFDAPEADLISFRHSDPLKQNIPIEVGVTKEDGFPHVGKVNFRDNKVEVSTGTIRIRGVIDNPKNADGVRLLFPGMYARIRVPKAEPATQLALPEDCLLSGQEGRFLYVVGADGKVEKRVVTVGAVVWKAPPVVPGAAPPSWVAVNPSPAPPAEGQPPAPTRRVIRSVVAITAGLQPNDRVVLDGLQQARPGNPVAPEEWNLMPPAEPKK
ncbi:MAG: efflux RND transporter periplasmic adaptor subunit [Planctomycetes bacterium]|nr:efflux RND transporter periplasmic adaptor subunit [Planctomycetota bacterium]